MWSEAERRKHLRTSSMVLKCFEYYIYKCDPKVRDCLRFCLHFDCAFYCVKLHSCRVILFQITSNLIRTKCESRFWNPKKAKQSICDLVSGRCLFLGQRSDRLPENFRKAKEKNTIWTEDFTGYSVHFRFPRFRISKIKQIAFDIFFNFNHILATIHLYTISGAQIKKPKPYKFQPFSGIYFSYPVYFLKTHRLNDTSSRFCFSARNFSF